MSTREVPIVIITGYLGSGKTTLMQNILKQEQRKIALIVNDMGSINIDASLLNKTGNKVTQVEMVEMQNGCICCTLRDEFMAEIERLSSDRSIEAIFVEASGISEPSSIAGAFLNYEEMTEDTRVYLKSVVSVVDVDRIYREFLHNLTSDKDAEEGDVINLIMDQIKEETLGQRIRAQRIRLGMTQEELAERLYMKKSTISYYETDKKEMRASSLAEIARALYTTPDYLLGFEEEKEPFEKEALGILQGIKDDTVREMLLKQMRALI